MEVIAFKIIAAASEASSLFQKAFGCVKEGKYDAADKLMIDGEKILNEGHKIQRELVTKESNGENIEIGTLIVHAQNHLMNAVFMRQMIKHMITMQKEINELKGKEK